MTGTIGWAIVIVIGLAILIVILARLYERATREVSLVRTGVGGRKVVMDGGTLAVPYFHDVARVNMQTLRLEVSRNGEAALITRDRLRVDVGVAFYVSVIPTPDGIARAAQTLGNRTFQPEQLRELIEGKLVDALRSVAARLSMDELHEGRGTFVADVREVLRESLARNGLELDSVSLTALDQTPFRALDENNAFNAVGLRKLAEVIAKARKERAEIDSDADVSVRRAAMEATRRKLQIELEEQEAQIAQVQQIETLRAAQVAEVVKRKADGEREAARARIRMEQDIRAAEIAKDKELQTAEIARDRDLEIANQERQITISRKSQEESKARGEADEARAKAVRAVESIATARQVAEAERRAEIALIEARKDAEIAGNRLRMAAQAERDAAGDRGQARVDEAKAAAEATQLRSSARKQEMLADAEGQRALNEAENVLNERAVLMKLDLARIDAAPKVLAEMVKPAEKIESIRIHQISGFGGGAGGAGGTVGGTAAGAPGGAKPPINQVLDSIMDMAVQLPALRKIGEEIAASLESGLGEAPRTSAPRASGKQPAGKPAQDD